MENHSRNLDSQAGQLTGLQVYALLAILEGGPRHGYDIHRLVKCRCDRIPLIPAPPTPSIYKVIEVLLKSGLVIVFEAPTDSHMPGRPLRKEVYGLTDAGINCLQKWQEMTQQLADETKALFLPQPN